jgi:transposase InsO family protein
MLLSCARAAVIQAWSQAPGVHGGNRTIRMLTAAGLITPEPKKRPKSSYRRFQADQPNECWQSDFTHWQLADRTGVEIINWLDDHSRYLLASRAHRRITGQTVITTFLNIVQRYGLPQSTLTDNGSAYTPRGLPALRVNLPVFVLVRPGCGLKMIKIVAA